MPGGDVFPLGNYRAANEVLSKIEHTFVVSDPTLPDCPVVFASDSFLRLCGYDRGEILGHNCRFLQGDDTDQAVVRELREAVMRAESVTCRLVNYKKNGEAFWNLLTLCPVKNGAGRVIKIVGVQIDVTSRLQEEEAAVAMEGKSHASNVLKDVSQGIIHMENKNIHPGYDHIMDMKHTFCVSDPALPDCPVVFCSDGFLALTGYERDEVLGRNCRFLQGERTSQLAVGEVRKAVAEGTECSVRMINYKKNGQPFWNYLTVRPIKNAGGEVIKFVGVQIDVTNSTTGEARKSLVNYDGRLKEQANDVVSEITLKVGIKEVGEPEEAPSSPSFGKRLSQQLMRKKPGQNKGGKKGKGGAKKRLPRVAIDLATTVERLDHAFLVCDLGMEESPVVFASDAFLRMMDCSREDILGRHPRMLLNPASRVAAEAEQKLDNLLANQAEAGLRCEAVRSDGSPFPSLIQLCPMKDAGGACKFLVVVVIDESQGERRDSLMDIASVGTALHGMMGAASTMADADFNPFEELDANSGQLAPKIHAANDKGYQLLQKQVKDNGPLRLANFRLVRKLGSGASGDVSLIELGETGHCFALKTVNKEDMIRRNKTNRVLTEDRVLREVDHPLLALCYGTISTQKDIHYLLKQCEGGDLYQLLNSQGALKEEHVKFYVAEVITSLKYLHLLGFIYRDLKPENVLLSQGHAIVTDFDLTYGQGTTLPRIQQHTVEIDVIMDTPECIQNCGCAPKVHSSETKSIQVDRPRLIASPVARANSFVGTQDYLAPEIIIGNCHSTPVDWWSLGVLCYELTFGNTPFQVNTASMRIQARSRSGVVGHGMMTRTHWPPPAHRPRAGKRCLRTLSTRPWSSRSTSTARPCSRTSSRRC